MSIRFVLLTVVVIASTPALAAAQLSSAWIVPAAAHAPGVGGTFWYTDVAIHNPQGEPLPIVVQLLETGLDNSSAPTLDLELGSWETVNLWDVLGPDWFAATTTGALLVYVPLDVSCAGTECDFLVTSRTYTLDPAGSGGEYGQAIPGATVLEGVDWSSFGYGAGVLNDGDAFRCNAGVASWSADWTTVQMDVQDASGAIVDTEVFDVPPFGHVQRRVRSPITGGSLVFYLVDGPGDAVVYPYASVVDQDTGDPAYVPVRWSTVGVAAAKVGGKRSRPTAVPGASSRRSVPAGGAVTAR